MENKPKFKAGDIITFSPAGWEYLGELSQSKRGAVQSYPHSIAGVIIGISNFLTTRDDPIIYEIKWQNELYNLWSERYLQLLETPMQRIKKRLLSGTETQP